MRKVLTKIFGDPSTKKLKSLERRVAAINALGDEYKKLSDKDLKARASKFRKEIADGNSLDDLLTDVFALVREAADRTLGQRHFDVQLIGGMALHEGNVAEMKTGEGKTLVATLPVSLNGLTGKGVHVVTVNDYLAQRDAGWMGAVYSALGLSVGVIIPDNSYIYDPDFKNTEHEDERFQHLRPVTRREAYEADITYGTNNEFGFDYLRDNMVRDKTQLRQRDLAYAIVDEVDSILIDEARTPLIISAPASQSGTNYSKFAAVVRQISDEEVIKDEKRRAVNLTDEGVAKVQKILGIDNLYGPENVSAIYHLEQALRAEKLFTRDKDYVVTEDGEVIIVDEFTGRLMHGRRYNEGLHQAIEAKEGVEVRQESMTLATISFQNYFRLYDKLAGMTGTAATEADEFYEVYKLEVVEVPTNKPMIRNDKPDRIYKSVDAKFKALVSEAKALQEKGQPVLIGTVSIEMNELLSRQLSKAGVKHSVLNAKNHESEAAIVAKAGQKGAVTLATNIAGRGTDIVLGEGVREQGGLMVIGSERHESRRIDNQLRGRAGRQGDPGVTQFYVSAEDDLMRIFGGDRIATLMNRLGVDENTPIENKTVSKALESAQKKVENHNFDSRKQVVQYDDVMNRHRTAVYKRRREILMQDDVKDLVQELLEKQVEALASDETMKPDDFIKEASASFPIEVGELKKMAKLDPPKRKEKLQEAVEALMKKREKDFGENVMRSLERDLYLQVLDTAWMQHLENMNHLREGIGWRSIGQRDPLVEYRREGQNLYEGMQASIEEEVSRVLFRLAPVNPDEPPETELTKAAQHSVEQGAKEGSVPRSKPVKEKSSERGVVEQKQHTHKKADARKKKKAQRKNRKKHRR